MRRAHPRSRGENDLAALRCRSPPGSSPLTRGKHQTPPRRVGERGLIPAHAGKTISQRSNSLRKNGSSPLTRGKQAGGGFDLTRSGLIPAHAGKTAVLLGFQGREEAHPRSRGENSSARLPRRAWCGSSPLTRGKRALASGGADAGGLIPAHAGKTLPDLLFYRADRSDLGKP